jgi:hypothetical protein
MYEQIDLEQPLVKQSLWERVGAAVCDKFFAAFCYDIGASPLEARRFMSSTCWYGGFDEMVARETMARLRQHDEVGR